VFDLSLSVAALIGIGYEYIIVKWSVL